MSNLTRWEPARQMMTLREAMDRLFDDAFTRPFGLDGVSGMPAIDLFEDTDEVVVKAALPGLKADDVQITLSDNVLTLSGELKQEMEKKDTTYHIREQHYGQFERSIMMPTDVQSDNVKAEFENGILTITLPKAEAVKPKTISIKAK
jgi:HSP20 family protein